MIGFLLPKLAWLALLALVPVAIHLLNRVRLRRVEFSSLEFLRDVRREKFNWLRLRELLLLILRTALLLFLFLGLSRPFLRRGLAGARTEASAVLVIDNSMSMSAAGRFERARRAAQDYLARLTANSEVAVITTGDPAAAGLTRNPHTRQIGIDSLEPGCGSAGLGPALESAARLLGQATLPRREIVVFTDLQRSALRDAPKTPGHPVLFFDCGDQEWQNCAVTEVLPVDRLAAPGASTGIAARVRNFGTSDQTRTLTLELGALRESRIVNVPAGEERRFEFAGLIPESGADTGVVSLDPDSLEADDRRFFVARAPQRSRILVIGELPEDTFFLARALVPDSAGPFAVSTRLGAGLRTADLKSFQAAVIVNPHGLSLLDWQRLEDYLGHGGGLLVLTGRAPSAGPILARVAGIAADVQPTGFVSIEQADFEHPALGPFRNRADLGLPRFSRFARFSPAGSRVLARLSDGSPFLVEAASERVMVMASDCRMANTDLPLRALFVPLLHRLVGHLARGDEPRDYLVGDTIPVRLPAVGAVQVLGPDGEFMLSGAPGRDGAQDLRFTRTARAGFYRFDERTHAVNVPASEGDLTRLSETELNRAGVGLLRDTRPRARDLTGSLLLAAALCLIAEMLVLVL
jgi:hypothetical protein